MEVSVEVQDGVIFRNFHGEVRQEDIIESWNKIFADFENLQEYKGVISVYLDAEVVHVDDNLNLIVEYLKEYRDRMNDLKIAIVKDPPIVTNTIILGQRMKHLQIKPFSTVKEALTWVQM
jgi:hypothetical protein